MQKKNGWCTTILIVVTCCSHFSHSVVTNSTTGTCQATEFFDQSSYQCLDCTSGGTNRVIRNQGTSCVCNPTQDLKPGATPSVACVACGGTDPNPLYECSGASTTTNCTEYSGWGYPFKKKGYSPKACLNCAAASNIDSCTCPTNTESVFPGYCVPKLTSASDSSLLGSSVSQFAACKLSLVSRSNKPGNRALRLIQRQTGLFTPREPLHAFWVQLPVQSLFRVR